MALKVFNSGELEELLMNGSPAIFPTDTLPALGALPSYADQLWRIKQRPLDKPLILMGSSSDILLDFVSPEAIDDASLIASRYWPGEVTMVLPSSSELVRSLNPGLTNLGFRVPKCSLARDLLSLTGPLATTSANLAGDSPCLNAEEARKCFPEIPLLGPLPWPSISGKASTVILWGRKRRWQILRRGAVIPEGDTFL